MTRIRTLVGMVGCCLLLGACASRPSADELTEAILVATNASESSVALSTEQATCIANELLNSGLSDTTLSGLAEDFDKPQVLETEADQVEPMVAAAALTCQSGTPGSTVPADPNATTTVPADPNATTVPADPNATTTVP